MRVAGAARMNDIWKRKADPAASVPESNRPGF
jgi:hypothetical protein